MAIHHKSKLNQVLYQKCLKKDQEFPGKAVALDKVILIKSMLRSSLS
jgi:hypothetical protein